MFYLSTLLAQVGEKTKIKEESGIGTQEPLAPSESFFGRIKPPPGVIEHGSGLAGLAGFISIILKFLIVAGGVFALLNIIFAGYAFMSAGGDPKSIEKAWAKIWQSLVGLLLVAGSFVLAAVFGQLLFGDPGAIINLRIFGPGT